MQHKLIAKKLQQLGHETRLNIYRALIKAGPDGLAVGVLQKKLQIPSSTLSHHISRLVTAGLVEQHRNGPTLICKPKIDALNTVIDYLKSECCSESTNKC